MIENLDIRESLAEDVTAIEALYPAAFPDEDLLPLVKSLLTEDATVLSLVGIAEGALAGHVLFTDCGVAGRSEKLALLAPLAVHPDRQRQGVGSALVRAGLQRLRNAGTDQVYVLGDPSYYGRFGFAREDRVTPPYALPEEWRDAWQSLGLSRSDPPLHGALSVPPAWRQPALWGP